MNKKVIIFSSLAIMSFGISSRTLEVKVKSEEIPSTEKSEDPTKEGVLTGTWGSSPVTFDKDTGLLTVKSGTIDRLFAWNGTIDSYRVQNIKFIGDVKTAPDFGQAFSGFSNVETITGPLDTSNTTDMELTFSGLKKLKYIELSDWDVSNVTNMSGMFVGSSSVESLDVGKWNVSNVTNMSEMFKDTESLKNLDISKWNTSNVRNMAFLFAKSSSITELDVSRWDTSKVESMYGTFTGAKSLKKIPVENWNVSNVTTMHSMFSNLDGVTDIVLGKWDTSNVNSMAGMFKDSSNLKTIDISNFNVSKVNSAKEMFYLNKNLKELDFSKWENYKMLNVENMLYGTDNLEKITMGPKSHFNRDFKRRNPNISAPGKWVKIEPVLPENSYSDGKVFMEQYDGNFSGVYVRKSVNGTVKTKYIDTEGNEISSQNETTGTIGAPYSTEQKHVDGYTFKEVKGNTTGTFTESEQTVTYIYTKDPVAGASVIAKYVDEQGNTISESVVLNGNVGNTYTTEQQSIAGYTFKEVQGNTTGTFTESEQTVTYIYTKDPVAGASVIAKYVDEQGNTISESVVLNGNVGNTYTTEQKSIAGYTFKEVQGNTTGTFTESEQTVTYIYTKDPVAGASVIAKYVDEQGNTISESVVLNRNVGNTYKTEQKSIAGYTFKEVKGNTTGTFTESEQTVTYIYTKNEESIVNREVDFDSDGGSPIPSQKVENGKTLTRPQNPTKEGFTFKEWQLNGETFDFNNPVTGDMKLKAIYIKNEPSVNVNENTNNSSSKSLLPTTGETSSLISTITGIVLILFFKLMKTFTFSKSNKR